LDDDPALQGTEVCGLPVLGTTGALRDDEAVAICVGNPRNFTSRARLAARLDLPAERYATLVHPTAVLPASVAVGHGTVIHALTVATGWSTIGAHVAVMPAAVITHDDMVGDFSTIAAGVRLAGGVTVETGAYIGSGALVREDVTIGAWSLVGMGSVVTRSIPPGEVWAGIPATYRRSSDQQVDFPIPEHAGDQSREH
jgi:sugar O-acyltransferase (sialic acid O-acetyltransferase NeuD family)